MPDFPIDGHICSWQQNKIGKGKRKRYLGRKKLTGLDHFSTIFFVANLRVGIVITTNIMEVDQSNFLNQ